MSSSRQIRDPKRQRRGLQKSSFAHTCNLLSQYIKDKGSLRDLNLEIDGRVESLEALVKPKSSNRVQASNYLDQDKENQAEEKPSSIVKDDSHKSTSNDSTAVETKSAPLTMFYSGKVLVFRDFPEDKAGELLALAKQGSGSSQMSYGIPSKTLCATEPTALSTPNHASPPPSTQPLIIPLDACREKIDMAVSRSRVPAQPEADTTGLPIARRSSIHRFLEKRKDRSAAVARAPYEIQQEQLSSFQLDLKL